MKNQKGLTVGKLKEILENYPDDNLVIVAKDAYGSSFSPLFRTDPCFYTPYKKERSKTGHCSDEETIGSKESLCLWPII